MNTQTPTLLSKLKLKLHQKLSSIRRSNVENINLDELLDDIQGFEEDDDVFE